MTRILLAAGIAAFGLAMAHASGQERPKVDFDVGNQKMLAAGAYFAASAQSGDGWTSMASAPRDGTLIEVRCTYGVAPWFGLYRWMPTPGLMIWSQDGQSHLQDGRWAKFGSENLGFNEDRSFSWRPYTGNPSAYVDPTGGAQDSMAYWRGASAAKFGLPLNAFEAQTAKNIARGGDAP